MLSIEGGKGENFDRELKKKAWRYPFGLLEKFKRGWCGDTEIVQNPLFLGVFRGFLKSSEEEKGPQITNLEKNI
jgi:hypothetical protein